MSDSAIALEIFGSDKAVLATDVGNGVHTLKVTTDVPSDGIVVPGFGAAKYVIGTVKAGGVHTLCATTTAANAAIALEGAGANKILLGTVQSNGVHVIAVTTDAANGGVAIDAFGSGLITLGTVQSGGVHTLAATATPDNGFGLASFAAGDAVLAAARSGSIYSLALSGLAPPIDPEAAAYFTAAGITDNNAKTAINAFILASKAALGITLLSQFFDRIWILGNQNAAAALTDVLLNTSAIAVNGPAFVPYSGYVGDGLTQYLDFGVAPSGCTNYMQNDAGFSIYTNNNLQSNGYDFGIVYASAFLARRGNDSAMSFVNDSSTSYLGYITNSIGLYVARRQSSATKQLFLRGTLIGNDSVPSVTRSGSRFFGLGASDGNSLVSAGNHGESLVAIHKSMTDQQISNWTAAVTTLATSLGWPV